VGRQAKVGRAREVGLGVRERGVESEGRERTSQELGRDANGLGRRPGRVVSFSFFFPISISSLKQANTFEFKPGFEFKHPKTMHRHECNTHNYLFNLEKNQRKDFSYTIFSVKN
jgi:hypothetical protein